MVGVGGVADGVERSVGARRGLTRDDVGHPLERATVEREEPDPAAQIQQLFDVVAGEELTEHGCGGAAG